MKVKKLKTDPLKLTENLKLEKYKVEISNGKDENKNTESSDDESEIVDLDDKKGLDNVDKIENECGTIIKLIKEIIDFSKKEKILAIYLKSTFWINLLKEYNFPDWENIRNIFMLRELFKNYNSLVDELYEEENKGPKKKEEDESNKLKKI
jgi:hypothetical protein